MFSSCLDLHCVFSFELFQFSLNAVGYLAARQERFDCMSFYNGPDFSHDTVANGKDAIFQHYDT